MAKKKASKKGTKKGVKKKISKKKNSVSEKTEAKSKKPFFILIIIAVAIIVTLMLVIFPKAYSFEEAVQKVEKIDNSYNISFSDYSKGLYYLQYNPRYPHPLNPPEMDEIIKKYSSIKGEEPVELFIDFRTSLMEAEKHYRQSKKSYKGEPVKYGVYCSQSEKLNASIENTEKTIEKMKEALSSIEKLRQEYPEKFEMLEISEDWIDLLSDEAIDFKAEIRYKRETFDEICYGNVTKH